MVCSRFPFTYGRPPLKFRLWFTKDWGFGVMTPGSSNESWPVLRPFRGSELTVFPEMTSPTVADSVWRTGASAVTSTVSSSEPTASLKSSRAICLICFCTFRSRLSSAASACAAARASKSVFALASSVAA